MSLYAGLTPVTFTKECPWCLRWMNEDTDDLWGVVEDEHGNKEWVCEECFTTNG